MHIAAEHSGQRREGLGLPRHLPDDPGEPGRRGARLHVLLRRGGVVDAPQGRPEGHVHEDPARVQEPGGRGELAPLHVAVPRRAADPPHRHVRDLNTIAAFW